MVICKIHLDGRIIFYMMWCVPCNLDRIGGVAYFLIGHAINKVLKVMLIIIGLIHVRFIYLEYKKPLCIALTGRNFTILLRVVSRVHHMNTGILSDFHEGMTTEWIHLQYLRSELFGLYYTSRQKRNQMYLIIGINTALLSMPVRKVYYLCQGFINLGPIHFPIWKRNQSFGTKSTR